MRPLLALLSLLLVSCANGPSANVTLPTGEKIVLRTGGSVLAKRELVTAQVTGGGFDLKYSAAKEDSTEVANNALGVWLAAKFASLQAGVTNLKTQTDGAVALKGTLDPNVIPVNPNIVPVNPNIIPK